MGKYIWPKDVGNAAYWYLSIIKELGSGVSIGQVLQKAFNDPNFGKQASRRGLQRSLYNLQRSGLVEKQGSYNKATYNISRLGINKLDRLSFLSYAPPTLRSWDGHWRLVLFDIPENLREARYHIRRLLKELGFVQLQLSAWVHPLPYLEAFNVIQRAYGIEKHLLLLELVEFSPDSDILKHFKQSYPKLVK